MPHVNIAQDANIVLTSLKVTRNLAGPHKSRFERDIAILTIQ